VRLTGRQRVVWYLVVTDGQAPLMILPESLMRLFLPLRDCSELRNLR